MPTISTSPATKDIGASAAARHMSTAFAVDCHVWDSLHETHTSLAALIGVVNGVPFDHLNEVEQGGLKSLLDRLAWLEGDLIEALLTERKPA